MATALVLLRQAKGYVSRSALAREVDVSHSMLALYEKGLSKPAIDVALRYAAALSITVPELNALIEQAKSAHKGASA